MTTLQDIDGGSANAEVPVNENFETLSAAAIFGKRHPATSELVWGYYGGRYNGNSIADGTVNLTDNSTNYVVVERSSGTVSVSTSTTNWDDADNYARLYKLTTSGGAVTVTLDSRFDTGGLLNGASSGSGGSTTDSTDENSLVDLLRAGRQPDELFTRSNGINEFELVWDGTNYYLFCHDFGTGNTIKVRKATTIAGLSGASEVSTGITGAWPSVWFDGSTWHLFAVTGSNTVRYTASTGDATSWTSAQTVGAYEDVQVRQAPDGTFWASYKEPSGAKRSGLMTAPAISGPWTDRGYVFSTIGRAAWHASEEADPIPLFHNGRAYWCFAGWDGSKQRVGVAEMDVSTFKVKRRPVVLVEPLETWQQRGSSNKVFGPIWVVDEVSDRFRLYYAHNPSASSVTTGWSYIEASDLPADGRRDTHLALIDLTRAPIDKATGIKGNVWGVAKAPGAFLDLVGAASDGGLWGWLNQPDLTGDFTASIEFELTTIPGSGSYARLFRLGTSNQAVNPVASVWALGTGSSQFRLYFEVRDASNSGPLTGSGSTTTLAASTRYRVTMRRKGNTIAVYLNGSQEASGSFSLTLVGASEFALANGYGSVGPGTPDSQQMAGRIYRFEVLGEALPLSRV